MHTYRCLACSALFCWELMAYIWLLSVHAKEAPSVLNHSASPCHWKKQECGTVPIAKMGSLIYGGTSFNLLSVTANSPIREGPKIGYRSENCPKVLVITALAFFLTKRDLIWNWGWFLQDLSQFSHPGVRLKGTAIKRNTTSGYHGWNYKSHKPICSTETDECQGG